MTPPEGDDEQDLTRKQRREQARADRKAVEEAHELAARRRRRLSLLGGTIVAVVVIVVVILVATGGGSKSPVSPKGPGANKEAKVVSDLLNGIPQSGNVLGLSSAPVTVQYFGDLECPICKEFTLNALPTLINNYVRAGKLRIEYRSMETATHEPETFKRQQIAALAAGKQNKMWDYVELFYHEQGQEDTEYATEEYLQDLARQISGLNVAKWHEDRQDPAYSKQLAVDEEAVTANGFEGTPAFLIGHTGGAMKVFQDPSITSPSGFEAEIKKLAA